MNINNEHPLKNYLKNNKISVTKFAEEIKRNRTYLYKIFNKENRPSPMLAKKISNITGIPIIDLLYPEEENGTGRTQK